MITVRIISTYKQFVFFTTMLQWLTDLLFKKSLMVNKRYQNYSHVHMAALQLPFEIIVVHVPKNFIRKLVGYQEKNLMALRKSYTVDFDYNRELLNDEVFPLNENTQLRIFGNSVDVRIVNDLIQKDLE